jgi:hypothetical protein
MLRRRDASIATAGPGKAKRGPLQKAGVGRPSDSRRGEIKQLDALARRLVMLRDRDTCQKCGRVEVIQWAHIHTRGVHSMRWEPDNSLALCKGCHYQGHLHPTEFSAWFTGRFPERAARLTLMRQTPRKMDRKLMRLWLEQEANRMEGRCE